MDKYKVLLVDDEEEAIEAIRLKLEWETLGFEVIGSANNGVKALELVERLQPDVVITDIKMPYMDGLELARALNEDYQNIHIIIFTGFDEFEYAKEAVHLEIEEYMLKPINSQELSECLKRLKKTLDNEREEKLNVKKLEHYFNASLPMFQTNLFISLIEGRITEADCEKFLAAYQIHMTGPLFGCAVFHTSEHHVPEGMNALLLSMSVEQEIRERIAEKWKSQMFTYLGNTVLVMELNSEEEAVAFTDDCDRFCRWAYRVMGAVVTAGIGRACDSLFTINQSYAGAREAVSYRVLYGTQRAINIGEIAPTEQEISVQSEDTKMHALFKTINLGSREEIEKAAQSEIEKLHRNAKTVSQYKLATMEMVGAFYRFCANNFIDFKDYPDGRLCREGALPPPDDEHRHERHAGGNQRHGDRQSREDRHGLRPEPCGERLFQHRDAAPEPDGGQCGILSGLHAAAAPPPDAGRAQRRRGRRPRGGGRGFRRARRVP